MGAESDGICSTARRAELRGTDSTHMVQPEPVKIPAREEPVSHRVKRSGHLWRDEGFVDVDLRGADDHDESHDEVTKQRTASTFIEVIVGVSF